ncbi:MAG: hypothetical protein KF862_12030 [Chitinophagaceae bacterium]|nr:hypothetical protein [Chitinophagaceae bacterium]
MAGEIPPDKWKHFIVGIPMGAILQVVCNWMTENPLQATIITFVIVVAISYGFELFSKITRLGRYDFLDAVASVIGGVLGMGLVWLF